MGAPMLYGWVDRELYATEGRVTVVGPYATRSAAQSDALKYGATEVVEVRSRDFAGIVDFSETDVVEERSGELETVEDDDKCGACGTTHDRLPMTPEENAVYDAIFPDVLHWSEYEDCDMNDLMRKVAVAAAAALVK